MTWLGFSPIFRALFLAKSVGTKQRSTSGWNQVLWQVVRSVTTVANSTGFCSPFLYHCKFVSLCAFRLPILYKCTSELHKDSLYLPSRVTFDIMLAPLFACLALARLKKYTIALIIKVFGHLGLALLSGKETYLMRCRSTRRGTCCMRGCTETTKSGW